MVLLDTVVTDFKAIWLVLFVSFGDGIGVNGDKSGLLISSPLGIIEGYIGKTVNSNPFYKFEGIQYAKPPIGSLRFEDPQDPEPWIGIWKANVLTRCMQYDHFQQDHEHNYVVHGDEDCLHVNIYTHSTDPEANLDVLVHIHGGAFMFGRGASYGPDIIMDRPIVFVNFNYRLGPLGFLSTEDDILPGNTGLKDQIKALKWVKENIKYFGGNADSITIYGLSAGGASVHLHYLLPASRGLFKRGISQSGCALNPWVLAENVKEKTHKVAELVGCPPGNSNLIKTCLKGKPARHIVQTVKEFQSFLYNPFSPLGVVVDAQWAKNPVLPNHPYILLKKGKVFDAPWIVSYTKDEGLYPASEFWADDQHLKKIDTRWNEILPDILHYNETIPTELKDEVSQKIRTHYLGNKAVNRDTYSNFVDILSDRLFISDIEISARLQNAAVKSSIFSYLFNYRGAVSKSKGRVKSEDNIGISHGDDTIYILSSEFNTYSNEQDKRMGNILIDMCTSFMQVGHPNITSEWRPLDKHSNKFYSYLKISGPDNYKLVHAESVGERTFWESLLFKENQNLDSQVNNKNEL